MIYWQISFEKYVPKHLISLLYNFYFIFRRRYLTLSLLRYLKTRIRWGGVNLTPPSKSHVWCPNMTNDTSLESSCALLLESAKKFANLQKLNFFFAKSSFIVKMFAKKKLSKNNKLYIFEKPLTMPFQICKKFCKILNNLMFN